MLKKLGIILAITGLGLVSNVAWANNQAKIATVKKVYSMALNDAIHQDPLYTYGDKSLRQAWNNIDAEKYYECVADYNLVVQGQDFDFKASSVKYTVLQNGRVRASFKNFGTPSRVDYTLTCSGNSCKISDISDADISSLKKKLLACR